MKSQLYVPEVTRRYLQSQISSFVEIYFQKLLPVFRDIEKDADKRANDFYNEFMNQPSYDDSIDPASIAEKALNIGIEHYSYLKLGKYHLTAIWHAMLYQLWEQQLRSFLFREISHVKKIDFKGFCKDFGEITDELKFHNVDIKSFSCWAKIDELRELCNVIKHGDGRALNRLRKINPSLFKKGSVIAIDLVELYKTSLLEETLNLNETTLQDYKDALLSFWEEIPERNYSNDERRSFI